MVRQRVAVTTLSLVAILPFATDLPAQEVIDLPAATSLSTRTSRPKFWPEKG